MGPQVKAEPGVMSSFSLLQVEQQGAGAVHIDNYMQGQGLSGQGLCARALYDYQAGKIPNHRPRSWILRLGDKNV